MGGHGWAEVVVDGCGLGMGTNSKEMLGSIRWYIFLITIFHSKREILKRDTITNNNREILQLVAHCEIHV